MVKLHDIPRNTKIDVRHLDLVEKDTGNKIETLLFSNLDSPKAMCFTEDGGYVLLYGDTEVKIIK